MIVLTDTGRISEKAIDCGIERIRFARLPFKVSWNTLIWREAQNWPRHHMAWEHGPGHTQVGFASLAPLGFFVEGSYE